MSSLLVLAFSSQSGAERILTDIRLLQEQHHIDIVDAAIVIHKADGKVKIKQALKLEKTAALGDAFWGVLFGMTFFIPWVELAGVSYPGNRIGKLADYGIHDRFIIEIGTTIQPGYSGLFMIVSNITEDGLIETISRHKATLLRIILSPDDIDKLRDAFGAGIIDA